MEKQAAQGQNENQDSPSSWRRLGSRVKATVKRYHYDSHDQLRRHLANFVDAYNFGRRLKTLKGLTPYEFICKCWTSEPKRFKLNPFQKMPGPNT
ncbi:putative transposase [Nitrobacter sp. Nb-311A]|nr:putative transposase [Nitrobacter sp. Nb-311A]